MATQADAAWRYTVSPELLARPDMAAALAARDFRAVFLLVRKWGRVSQDRIAASVEGFCRSRISNITTGKSQVEEIDVIERICDGLRIPGHAVGRPSVGGGRH